MAGVGRSERRVFDAEHDVTEAAGVAVVWCLMRGGAVVSTLPRVVWTCLGPDGVLAGDEAWVPEVSDHLGYVR